MFTDKMTRGLSAIAARRAPSWLKGRYRLAAVVVAVTAPTLAMSASAGAAPFGPSYRVTPIFLGSNWSGNAGYGSTSPGWFKEVGLVDPDVVHLQGAAKQTSTIGSDPNLLGTLPAAASPDRVVYTIVHTFNGTYADLSIAPNGQIHVIDPRPPAVKDYSFVSLEGITYEQFLPVGNPVAVNTANWSNNAGFGSGAPAWYEDGNFYVHLQGAVKQTSVNGLNANVIGTINGAAPGSVVYSIVHSLNGTYADVAIEPSGQIVLVSPRPPAVKDWSFVSLEGITYQGFHPGNAISINAANWSGNAGFGSRSPAWDIAAGIVHLQGAATQTSSSGSNSNLLGTLSPPARPHRSVFTVVHTFDGTYADISIAPNGQIRLIDPRSPALKDYTFVSLEGISYQR
jgi:hypothetical protein